MIAELVAVMVAAHLSVEEDAVLAPRRRRIMQVRLSDILKCPCLLTCLFTYLLTYLLTYFVIMPMIMT